MIEDPVGRCISNAFHRWCSKHRRNSNDPYPRVFGADGTIVAEKPQKIWIILSPADVPNNAVRWAAEELLHHLHDKRFGLARRSIRGALASSHAAMDDHAGAKT